MISEGSRILYAGDSPFNEVGARGKVLAVSGSAAHVQWGTGPRTGQVDLVEQDELLPDRTASRATTVAEAFDNSLEMAATPMLQVRATYDDHGEEGLVSALDESGHLAVLSEYVDEALGHLATRVRTDPVFSDVLAALEPDEASALVGRVASLLLNDRLSEG